MVERGRVGHCDSRMNSSLSLSLSAFEQAMMTFPLPFCTACRSTLPTELRRQRRLLARAAGRLRARGLSQCFDRWAAGPRAAAEGKALRIAVGRHRATGLRCVVVQTSNSGH